MDAETVAPEDAVLDLVWSVEPEGIVSIEGNVLTPLVNEDFIATLTAVNWDGTTRSTLLEIQRDLRALPAFTLPAMLTDIEEEAFAGISAQHVILPSSCTNIGSRAFADSSELLLVEIPSGTGNIADDAFEGCEGLTILAPAGSDAQLYAENHGLNFIAD